MNKTHFDQIIANYVDKFADLNSPATGQDETYKWRIAKQFKPKMDAALTASDEELSKALLSLRQLTYNLIDSTILPLTALSEYAKREPSTVRQMFLDLYSEDNGNLDMRMIKIVDFLETEEELRKKFFPTSWKFKNSVHSVTCYQTLYDPDHNYILKPSHCKKFADCIEFFDSWGCGTNTKLSVFYRMCDQVVDYIRENDALMKIHSSRYEMSPPDSLHPDTALHILAFDIIYCCSTFDLFHGITFNPAPNPKRLELQKELKKKAIDAQAQLEKAQMEAEQYETLRDKLHDIFSVGTQIDSKSFGIGTILKSDGSDAIVVDFPSQMKPISMGLGFSLAQNLISCPNDEVRTLVSENKNILNRGSTGSINYIFENLVAAEHEYDKYEAYLEL